MAELRTALVALVALLAWPVLAQVQGGGGGNLAVGSTPITGGTIGNFLTIGTGNILQNAGSSASIAFPQAATGATSGGVVCATSTTSLTMTSALTAGALVIGGGAGVCPTVTTTASGMLTALGAGFGTTNGFVAYGGALGTPTSGTLTNATGLPVGGIASIGSYTLVGNNTGSGASPTAVSVSSSFLSAAANATNGASGLAALNASGYLALAQGGTNASLTASNGGIVYSGASGFAILAGTVTANQCLLSGSSAAPTWGSCGGSGGNPGPYTVGTVITGSGALSNPAVNTTYCVTLTGAGTMTLPTATAGQRIVLKDCSGAMSATNTLTITPTSGNIDGQANFVMNTPYQSNSFWYNNQGSPQWSVE